MTEKRSQKSASFNVLKVTLLGIVIAGIIMELFLRVVELTPLWKFLPVAEVALYGPDPDTSYTIRPGVQGVWLQENRARISTSSQGLRDNHTPYKKPHGEFRIAMSGDSITEALQVDQDTVFSEILEAKFNATNKPVEVLNLGMSGANAVVQFVRMKSKGISFSPDAMVYIFNINDFVSNGIMQDNVFPGFRKKEDGQWVLSHSFRDNKGYKFRQSAAGQFYYFLLDNLRLARILNSRKNQGLNLNVFNKHASEPSGCIIKPYEELVQQLQGLTESEKKQVIELLMREISVLSENSKAQAAIIMRGLEAECEGQSDFKESLRNFFKSVASRNAILFFDIDKAVREYVESNNAIQHKRELYGFADRIGYGHLNPTGLEAYAFVIHNFLMSYFSTELTK